MSQKKRPQDAEGNKEKWNREEDPLQAVLIADSFDSKFSPITAEKPRVRLIYIKFNLMDWLTLRASSLIT